ncbi:hypothetical protein [Sulfobacillus thermosulfidooxidans]|uniref:hypothetical protein n=1 Tax=Sulfobacillus thermosulfidooxidans TaxID=28034 RepID=UPI0006B647A3|nr:hypothetical protein [Sulfobacillus thermosulfidooxidans]
MVGIAQKLRDVAGDLVGTALTSDLPFTATHMLQDDIWERDIHGEMKRTMSITPKPIEIPNWDFWLGEKGQEEWRRHPLATEITNIIERDLRLRKLVAQRPPAPPGLGLMPP